MAKAGVSEKTFNVWKCALDPNSTWIDAEIVENNAVRVWCSLCAKHVERLRGFRNFSDAFVNGIRGSALKRVMVLVDSFELILHCIVAELCIVTG